MTIVHRACFLAAVAGCSWNSPCIAATYGQLLTAQSRIGFVSRQMGVPVNGQFKRFSARVDFDPSRPEISKARIEVDLASIDAGSREANEEAVGKDWFFTKSFPVAVFESRRVKPLGGQRYEIQGSLGIKGRNRDLSTTASFREAAGTGIFEGSLTLKRLDFGIGEGPWGDPGTVADEVQVNWVLNLQAQTTATKP